ncbi:DinB family protein [Limnoglobus roseus]|uniref:DinB family protein n=1 Tax=Limnoglobus roseus TaxID=2598579 RepID=A0A5C1AIA6_9BACT|nr:DinB family protein [Limnoglobus roseus]QEL16698.1 DinB family protein [Limnoglobus roseus]
MSTDPQQKLRDHLLELLHGGSAHLTFEKATEGIPPALRGAKASPIPHTPWRLLEHLRIAQWDIVEFSVNPEHKSPVWPDGYWPDGDAPPDEAAWGRAITHYHADAARMEALVSDPKTDLFAKLEHGYGQTVLREAMLVADHANYHLGQLVVVRRLLGCWSDEK